MMVKKVLANVVFEQRSEEDEGAKHAHPAGSRIQAEGPASANALRRGVPGVPIRMCSRLTPQKAREGWGAERTREGGKGSWAKDS